MKRIASPGELQNEIRNLIQACSQEGVSRTAMADKLRDLADRLAAKNKLPTVTNKQIQSLRQEAGQAGDSDMVKICDKALKGDMKARAECARVINENSSRTAAAVSTKLYKEFSKFLEKFMPYDDVLSGKQLRQMAESKPGFEKFKDQWQALLQKLVDDSSSFLYRHNYDYRRHPDR